MKRTHRYHTFFYYIGAFLIPFILMGIILAFTGIWPFGNKTILTSDLANQYVQFLSYLREIYKGNHSIFYTFSKTFGGEMLSLSAYYLMSPLNLLLLLFKTEWLPQAIELLILIKISLCSLTFYFLISHLGKRAEASDLIFSVSYALMAYNMAYFFHLMWLDGIILLPLVILGIHRIFDGHFPALYILMLGFAIIFNCYIGFMICIFSVLYFSAVCIIQKKHLIHDFPIFFRYGLASLLAGLLSMFLLLPTLKGLAGGKSAFDTSLFTFSGNFQWNTFFIKFFNGCFTLKDETVSGLPNIFCGILILFLCILFFLNSEILLREKITVFALLAILYLSFYFRIFNLIWHGFNPPSSFPYRYSFFFSFVMLLTAWYSFRKFTIVSIKIWYPSVVACLLTIILLLSMQNMPADMSSAKYIFNIATIFATAILLTAYLSGRKLFLIICISFLCMFDLTTNGIQYLSCCVYKDVAEFQSFVKDTSKALSWTKANDRSFYRIEKTFSQKNNDPLLLDYAGLSHFSSSETTQVLDFLETLGFPRTFAFSGYAGTTYDSMNSFFGIRYLLSYTKLHEPYQFLRQIGHIYIYENPYALTLGMTADSSVEDFHPTASASKQPFETQNRLFSSILGDPSVEVFETQTLTPVLNNLRIHEGALYPYRTIEPEKEASFDYTFTASSDEPVYCYIDAPSRCSLKMYINDREVHVFNLYSSYQITSIGTFHKGDTVHIRIVPQRSRAALNGFYIAYQNPAVSKKYFETMQQRSLHIDSFSDTHITGTIDNSGKQSQILFTIPYDENWQIYVNDKRTDTLKLADALLGASLPAGICKIELKYVPQSFYLGLGISVSALTLSILWYGFFMKKRSRFKLL